MPSTPAVKSTYAYEEIRRRIVAGELPAGARLRLRPLGLELGLSEMPVREALRMLQRDGMVEIADHRGATVTSVSFDDVFERISVRMWLEVLAVTEAVPRHTAATLRPARAALARLGVAAEVGDAAAFSRENRRFHEAVEAPATTLVRELVRECWDRVWLARRQHTLFAEEPSRIAASQDEHRELLAAVEIGDGAAAAASMTRHRDVTLSAWQVVADRSPAPHR